MKRIGVIGLGTMGAPMAHNLLRAGFEVTVFNRTPAKCELLRAAGATVAASVREMAGWSDVVLLMLPDDAAVRSVVIKDGLLDSGKPGSVVIDSSTTHPHTSQEMAAALARRGIEYLDAPVTGSRREAETARLSFLVGGSAAAFRDCESIFAALGQRTFYLGGSGMGACAKLGNNMMGAIHMAALAEAMTLMESYGLDRKLFFEVISQSGARSAVVEGKGPKLLAGDFNPDFALSLMLKDTQLARELADAARCPAPLLTAASETYGQAKPGFGDADMSAVYQWYRQAAKIEG